MAVDVAQLNPKDFRRPAPVLHHEGAVVVPAPLIVLLTISTHATHNARSATTSLEPLPESLGSPTHSGT
jgi:hypothetical protein